MRTLALILMLLAAPAMAQQVPSSAAQMQLSFVPLVKEAAPAVVNIYARTITKARRTPLQADPFFERFFRDPFSERPRVQNSLGSGVILSADGIVVSNYHVVGTATDIRVVLNDRREYSARVLLGDADSDLAILKLEGAEDLPFLELRDSDAVEVGELALAIGNPFGVGQTVSSGIVSGLARSGAAGGGGQGYFIQTDAPINPGNSGGALIDMGGRLIGVNTSILTRSGGSNGIGFAIPADLVAAFVAQARAGETAFQRPWAGLSGQPVDADMAGPLGLDRPGGIIVSGLHPASPFNGAGLMVGDVIVSVDDQPVNTPAEMIYRMSVAGLGHSARVGVMREGRLQEVTVALIAAPDVPDRAEVTLGARSLLPGLKAARINPAVIAEMNLPLESAGVVVLDAGRFGPRVGLRDGDVVISVNGVAVEDTAALVALLAGQVRRIQMVIQRGDRRMALRFRG
ncbi:MULTISPECIES: trypsin-like peptidase domain-containing protein [Sulfitobacter]|uniref:trypsin-like peptidase domain-containing protein n=1 Tax=Sulfitobacter TaxID=60136 RepID=UPI0023078C15|nr:MULTISPECIES: trypsin-like peptidase domain-containing protein [Sulfitobacter]MDF3384679.1 PDZ domain-containing protein [Sulfitobacter sp. Ks11]MDF3388128.1 PDZ domain-containing protein [Sulfitobacter sp. M85]MDF3391549.1 PDZ domain-containing protein [Sulfitobacter sp. Ks16]MDF3402155.1 PDZ domain-containing protein [Sulfitobacter sp. KE39]MDF3405607.1 PDZ domain-containing protein [Sulfitobacter sp. Ks35]